MRIPKLVSDGLCSKCGQWIRAREGKNGLAEHKNQENGEECSNSGYSSSDFRYVVETAKEAKNLAEYIRDSDGRCLVSSHHSLACGDGDSCNRTSLKLAQALAVYHLKINNKETHKGSE